MGVMNAPSSPLVCTETNDYVSCQHLADQGLDKGCYYDGQEGNYRSCWTICNNTPNLNQCLEYCSEYVSKYCTSLTDSTTTAAQTMAPSTVHPAAWFIPVGAVLAVVIFLSLIALALWKCRVQLVKLFCKGQQTLPAALQQMLPPTETPVQASFIEPDEEGANSQQPNSMDLA